MIHEEPIGPNKPVSVLSVDDRALVDQERNVIPGNLSLSQRATIREEYERGWEWGCYLANIRLHGVVYAHMLWVMFRED